MKEIFVGSNQLTIKDDFNNISFPVLIQYPTYEVSKQVTFGPYIMDVSPVAEVIEGHFPLVIISHGSGGSPILYRTISTFLAKNGYIVVMIEHNRNNRLNNELEGKDQNFTNRLRHIKLTIDFMYATNEFKEHLQPNCVAVIGHSIGASTALVLAGGIPISNQDYYSKFGHPNLGQQEKKEKELITTDTRIKALVLLALTPGWFIGSESLKNVNIPVMILNAEKDSYISNFQTDLFVEKLRSNSYFIFQIVKNAGHFSFLSPFPESIKSKVGLASTDPDGFDREKFHCQFPTDILNFLKSKLNSN